MRVALLTLATIVAALMEIVTTGWVQDVWVAVALVLVVAWIIRITRASAHEDHSAREDEG